MRKAQPTRGDRSRRLWSSRTNVVRKGGNQSESVGWVSGLVERCERGSPRRSRTAAMSRSAARARAGRNRASAYQEITDQIARGPAANESVSLVKKKTPSLSVDLEPIEVILVIPVAFVGEYSQESARHASCFGYLPNSGNKRQRHGWVGVGKSK